jgi:TrmH family RNA methyltransferase
VSPPRISSRDNPLVKRLRRLAGEVRERKRSGQTLLDGTHLVEAWLAAGRPLPQLLVSDRGLASREIAALLAAHPAIPCQQLADGLFNEISPAAHPTGLLAVIDVPPPPAIDPTADTVLLDGVQDPGNLGSLLRTAAAAGFRQVLLSADCAQAWSPKALRAGMGAQAVLAVHEQADLAAFLERFSGRSYAADPAAPTTLDDEALAEPRQIAWVFGAEGQGIGPRVLAAVNRRLRIPMAAGCESLNVGAAAAVCLYETRRQRRR